MVQKCTDLPLTKFYFRDCATLNADTTFVKNGCSDQTSLAALAVSQISIFVNESALTLD